MQSKIFAFLKVAVPILFWLAVWEALALLLNFPYFLPDISATAKALFAILFTSGGTTYKILALTFLRVLISIALGAVFAVILSMLAYRSEVVRVFFTPLLAVMKSVPVAIFSILFYIFIRGDIIPILISFFMIMPMIWQNLMNGYDSIDKNLSEICVSFEFSYFKRLRILIFPTLIRYFIPALITSVGFAWKAVISSEILVRTYDSVGRMISDSKYDMNTALAFGWTILAVGLSIILEKITKGILVKYTHES